MRKKYVPHTAACRIRLEDMIRVRELEGDFFEYVGSQRVYTPAELGYVLGVSTTTVANLVRAGRLKCLNLRRAVRFTEEQLHDFIGYGRHATV
jgi:excisionase family DNA binding protein